MTSRVEDRKEAKIVDRGVISIFLAQRSLINLIDSWFGLVDQMGFHIILKKTIIIISIHHYLFFILLVLLVLLLSYMFVLVCVCVHFGFN